MLCREQRDLVEFAGGAAERTVQRPGTEARHAAHETGLASELDFGVDDHTLALRSEPVRDFESTGPLG
jgi:hypothetical protein